MSSTDPAGAESTQESPSEAPTSRSLRDHFSGWFAVIIVSLIVAVVVRSFLFTSFFIPSESMEPTLEVNDRLLVNRLSYTIHDISRGDIVVFDAPASSSALLKYDQLVKRVIGLPGERIAVTCGVVAINGKRLVEDYVKFIPSGKNDPACVNPNPASDGRNQAEVVIPAGAVFVLGDNRGNSEDSRVIGTIPVESIVGRAVVRYWPLNRMQSL